MNWIETLLITLGISLDVFGAVACQGALVAKIEKKLLAMSCLIVALLQMGALYLGSLSATLLIRYDIQDRKILTGYIIAAVIFICLGIRMLWKAWKNECIVERREDALDVKKLVHLVVITSIYTILVGVAFGFLKTSVLLLLIMIVAFTVAVVILGIYTGYRLGFEQKSKAFSIGGILLIAGGIDTLIRYVVF